MTRLRGSLISVLSAALVVIVFVMLAGAADPQPSSQRVRIGSATCVVREPDGRVVNCK